MCDGPSNLGHHPSAGAGKPLGPSDETSAHRHRADGVTPADECTPTFLCARITRVTTDSAPPEGYTEPSVVYCVEYVDPREPEAGWHQLGAFTTESEAQRLRGRLVAEGFFAELLINLIPVHQRVEDWEWDRYSERPHIGIGTYAAIRSAA
jgi:hypothetical protein